MPARRVILLVILIAAILWLARAVLIPFVFAALVAYAFTPLIDAAQARTRISRLVIVVAGYGSGLVVVALVVLAFAGPVSREAQMLITAGPDALTTALRQVLGADSVAIGDRTFTIQEVATQIQTAVGAFLQTPEGALRIAQEILHGSVDVIL